MASLNLLSTVADESVGGLSDEMQSRNSVAKRSKDKEQCHGKTANRPIKVRKPVKPKRPLTAYNFFFQTQRAKLLGIDPPSSNKTPEVRTKRKHRKTHGKFGFTELSRIISQEWSQIDAKTRAEYVEKQEEDAKRYKAELVSYKKSLHDLCKTAQKDRAMEKGRTAEKESCGFGTKSEQNPILEREDYRPRGIFPSQNIEPDNKFLLNRSCMDLERRQTMPFLNESRAILDQLNWRNMPPPFYQETNPRFPLPMEQNRDFCEFRSSGIDARSEPFMAPVHLRRLYTADELESLQRKEQHNNSPQEQQNPRQMHPGMPGNRAIENIMYAVTLTPVYPQKPSRNF